MAPDTSKPAPGSNRDLEASAHALADRMPELLVESRRVSHTVTHGIHGRRRAGPGETFWQYRHFEFGDSAASVDWRRSANSDHLYVREREWEAAHTVWMWIDMTPSMWFRSHLANMRKVERAIVLALAIGELLVRGGERIGLIGGRARANRIAVQELAATVFGNLRGEAPQPGLPPQAPLNRFSDALIFGDFLDPIEDIERGLQHIAMRDVGGHLIQILDPAEESLPYSGRVEFSASEGGETLIAGRAETLRERYQARLAAHREAIRDICQRFGWSFQVHHTDRPAGEALLAIHNQLAGLEQDYRYRPLSGTAPSGEGLTP